MTVRVAALQASASQCYTEAKFQQKVSDLVRHAASLGARIVVFPEDIGLWLNFCKESTAVVRARERAGGMPISQMSAPPTLSGPRAAFEHVSDWVFGHLHLRWLGDYLAEAKIERICARAFCRAAQESGVVVVGGSIYQRRPDGIYATCTTYDTDGAACGTISKKHLIPEEVSFGVKPGGPTTAIQTKEFTLGVCLCYDLNFPEVVAALAVQGAQVICAGTTGIRPWPRYPFDPKADMPQVERAKETGLPFVRAYQCGWCAPGLYFSGHASVVNGKGDVVASSRSEAHEEIVIADLDLKPKAQSPKPKA